MAGRGADKAGKQNGGRALRLSGRKRGGISEVNMGPRHNFHKGEFIAGYWRHEERRE